MQFECWDWSTNLPGIAQDKADRRCGNMAELWVRQRLHCRLDTWCWNSWNFLHPVVRRRGLERKLYLFPFSTSNKIINSHRTDTTPFINYPWVSFEIKYFGKKRSLNLQKKMKSDISQLPDFSLTERKCQEYVMIMIKTDLCLFFISFLWMHCTYVIFQDICMICLRAEILWQHDIATVNWCLGQENHWRNKKNVIVWCSAQSSDDQSQWSLSILIERLWRERRYFQFWFVSVIYSVKIRDNWYPGEVLEWVRAVGAR